jgi:hypothetical protein
MLTPGFVKYIKPIWLRRKKYSFQSPENHPFFPQMCR